MLIDSITENNLFALASGAVYSPDEAGRVKLQRVYLSSAMHIVSDYLGYDVSMLSAGSVVHGQLMDVNISAAAADAIVNTIMRIATLLQQEAGGNIGVNRAGDFGENRGFLNIVDYTPYLAPLSTLRLVGGRATEQSDKMPTALS